MLLSSRFGVGGVLDYLVRDTVNLQAVAYWHYAGVFEVPAAHQPSRLRAWGAGPGETSALAFCG